MSASWKEIVKGHMSKMNQVPQPQATNESGVVLVIHNTKQVSELSKEHELLKQNSK